LDERREKAIQLVGQAANDPEMSAGRKKQNEAPFLVTNSCFLVAESSFQLDKVFCDLLKVIFS
jgi:hypothetical protein